MSWTTSDADSEVVHDIRVRESAAVSPYPCQEQPELFFAIHGRALDLAKQLCAACPVRERCLSEALQRGEPHGVWGGQILIEGEIVATKRGPGRPRRAA
jgi:WhiB family transcriptional regulator, redox-sensing transcriptional regulator